METFFKLFAWRALLTFPFFILYTLFSKHNLGTEMLSLNSEIKKEEKYMDICFISFSSMI